MSTQLETIQKPFYDDEDEEDEEYIPTLAHGVIIINLASEIRNYIKGKSLGRVADSSVEYRFLVDKKPKTSRKPYRQPDASFIKQDRLPANIDVYPEIAPDLAVEVVSPSDREVAIQSKIALYQQYGVSLVWLVQPFSRRVDIYRLADGLLPQFVGIADELSGEDVIPGFKVKLTDIFDYPAYDLDGEIEA